VRDGQARVEWGVLLVAQCNSMSSPFGNQPHTANLLQPSHIRTRCARSSARIHLFHHPARPGRFRDADRCVTEQEKRYHIEVGLK
jgi:hypothetical protein